MQIIDIKISNFRGLNISVEDLKENFLIMGRNDTGKSNICYAIRKVLDPLVRRVPLLEDDSTNHNKEEINICMTLLLDEISSIQRSKIGKYIYEDVQGEKLTIDLKAVYNDSLMFYEETLNVGREDIQKFPTNKTNPIDSVLDIIYIEPNYNYDRNLNNYFLYKKKYNENNGKVFGETILNDASAMNESISSDSIVKEMIDDINKNENFKEIFENVSFSITSNIEIDNIYKSLGINFLDFNNKKIGNMGDGKMKALSMLLKESSFEKEKKKIIIIEEPENHMYPLLQKVYADLIDGLGMDQIIFTTHSPYIFDFKKMDQIIRLVKTNANTTEVKTMNITSNTYSQFGYLLNQEIGEILFYDKVLLVEGISEKYFYNTLFNNDEKFRKYVNKHKMGIFSIGGIDFYPIRKLLESLGIKVLIKTDNDIFKVPKIPLKRYSGIERVLKCLDENGVKELCNILSIDKLTKDTFRFSENIENNKEIEDHMPKLQSLFLKYGIILSIGHNGFEEDFLNFIGEQSINQEDMKFLKEAKWKNLHKYVMETHIKIKITENNKSSILVRFMENE